LKKSEIFLKLSHIVQGIFMTACPIDKPYSVVVIDTETTGLAPNGQVDGVDVNDPDGPDRICSIALMRMVRVANDPAEWKVTKRRMWLVNPGRPIPEHAAKVNGFAWSGDGSAVPSGRVDLNGKPEFSDIAIWVANFIDHQPIVAHNIAFDLAFLDAEFFRAGLDLTRSRVTCTKKAFSDMMGLGRRFINPDQI
jgi:DNA polymerase-3 subunit epsilon